MLLQALLTAQGLWVEVPGEINKGKKNRINSDSIGNDLQNESLSSQYLCEISAGSYLYEEQRSLEWGWEQIEKAETGVKPHNQNSLYDYRYPVSRFSVVKETM